MQAPPSDRERTRGDLVAGVIAGASMLVALIAKVSAAARGIDATFVAWWLALLVMLVPLLHLSGGGHGTRALGWLGLVPFVAGFACAACEWELTAAWYYVCGSGFLGIVSLPFLVGPVVGLGSAAARVATDELARKGLTAAAGAIALAFALAVAVPLAFLLAGSDAPSAEALLERDVTTIAVLPPTSSLMSPVELAGSKVARICSSNDDCALTVDGLDASILDEPAASIELAEGLGYRFLRRPSSEPNTWLAYRPGANYGIHLRPSDLGVRVAAPPGLGAAFAFAASIALLYVALAARRHRKARILGRSIAARIVAPGVIEVGSLLAACDPCLAIGPALVLGRSAENGTYRSLTQLRSRVIAGDRSALLAEASILIGEHLAAASVLLLLGSLPLLVALRSGLAIVW